MFAGLAAQLHPAAPLATPPPCHCHRGTAFPRRPKGEHNHHLSQPNGLADGEQDPGLVRGSGAEEQAPAADPPGEMEGPRLDGGQTAPRGDGG